MERHTSKLIRSAAINGPIEGVTTGGIKWLGNAVKANQVAKLSKPTQTTGLKPSLQLFAEEAEAVDWGMWKNLQKCAYKGRFEVLKCFAM